MVVQAYGVVTRRLDGPDVVLCTPSIDERLDGAAGGFCFGRLTPRFHIRNHRISNLDEVRWLRLSRRKNL